MSSPERGGKVIMVTLSPIFRIITVLITRTVTFVPAGQMFNGLTSIKDFQFFIEEETNNPKFVSADYLLHHYQDVIKRKFTKEFLYEIFFSEYQEGEPIKKQISRQLNQKPGILYEARRDSEGYIHVYIPGEMDAFKIISKKDFENGYKELLAGE